MIRPTGLTEAFQVKVSVKPAETIADFIPRTAIIHQKTGALPASSTYGDQTVAQSLLRKDDIYAHLRHLPLPAQPGRDAG